ncbi:AI-2E family transporter [Candidatus Woesearchaeota archaeon]|nr:AI-2E family transporter [Candidatus Woesearchaeota archaeon]
MVKKRGDVKKGEPVKGGAKANAEPNTEAKKAAKAKEGEPVKKSRHLKNEMHLKKSLYDNYMLILLAVTIAVTSIFILKPFIKSIVAAMVIAYIFYPLYKLFHKRLKSRVLTALIVLLIVLLIVTVPLGFILTSMYQEASSTIKYMKNNFPEKISLDFACDDTNGSVVCELINRIDDTLPTGDLRSTLKSTAIQAADRLSYWIYEVILSLSAGVLDTFIMFFIIFFLFIDGERFVGFVRKFIMLRRQHEYDITKTLEDTTFAVVYGSIIIALIQGFVAGIGYWLIAGMGNPILWAAVTALFALIPSIGTGIVWGPISLFFVLMGLVLKDYGTVTRGILLGLYGFFIVGTVDNLVKPKIIGDRARIHPVIVLIGVFGGLQLMGIIGVIVGPVVLAIMITLIRIYIRERNSIK